jgi:glutamyl-tRNA synthetase
MFNPEKLQWLNSQYINNADSKRLVELILPFLVRNGIVEDEQRLDKQWLSRAITTLKGRSSTLIELANSLRYYIVEEIEYDEKARTKFLNEKSRDLLIELKDSLFSIADFSASEIEKVFRLIIKRHNIKLGNLAQPVRVAMTGNTESPGIFEVLGIVGREKTLRRLDKAIETIKESQS